MIRNPPILQFVCRILLPELDSKEYHKGIVSDAFRTKIIDMPKEAMKCCDWDNEDNLENELKYTPPETAVVTRHCNPRNKLRSVIEFFLTVLMVTNARRRSRKEMAARIENMIGKMKMSVILNPTFGAI